MRERTTWSRQAAMSRRADPYLMNQDHKQPAADAYVIGGPSEFAEDVHPSKDTWEMDYKGGEVSRNEIGQHQMRPDTFNHNEKTASKEFLLKKANLCIEVSRMMLGSVSEEVLEDQAASLMNLPDEELVQTFDRMACQHQSEEQMQQAQGQQQMQQAQGQQQVAWNQSSAYQQAVESCKQALGSGDQQAADQAIQAMVQAAMQQAQGQQQKQQAQGQAQKQQAQGQQQMQQSQAQEVEADEMLELLSDPSMDGMDAEDDMGFELESPAMDLDDVDLGPEDQDLMNVMAGEKTQQQESDESEEEEEEAPQASKKANVRTASTRTVGTRPTSGVNRLGNGAPVQSGEVNKLSSLWATAPNVKDAFNI
jgi:hypothetical protein